MSEANAQIRQHDESTHQVLLTHATDPSVRLIERGRGPEIEGTRITVYRIMDYLDDPIPAPEIAAELELKVEQVELALSYIAQHRDEVDHEYAKIMERIRRGNPAWVEAGCAKSVEELKQRILAHHGKDLSHANRGGQ